MANKIPKKCLHCVARENNKCFILKVDLLKHGVPKECTK